MKNLAWLFIIFIIVHRIGLLVNVAVMNHATAIATAPISLDGLLETLGFMLMFAFWSWIALYTGWIIANLLLVYYFDHSIIRSIVAGASLPIVYLFVGTTWSLIVLHLIMGIAFGFLFHKFVNGNR